MSQPDDHVTIDPVPETRVWERAPASLDACPTIREVVDHFPQSLEVVREAIELTDRELSPYDRPIEVTFADNVSRTVAEGAVAEALVMQASEILRGLSAQAAKLTCAEGIYAFHVLVTAANVLAAAGAGEHTEEAAGPDEDVLEAFRAYLARENVEGMLRTADAFVGEDEGEGEDG